MDMAKHTQNTHDTITKQTQTAQTNACNWLVVFTYHDVLNHIINHVREARFSPSRMVRWEQRMY